MAKQEPWFKPRDEDGDEDLINWWNKVGNSPPPAPQQSSGSGCLSVAAPIAAVLVALLVLALQKGVQ